MYCKNIVCFNNFEIEDIKRFNLEMCHNWLYNEMILIDSAFDLAKSMNVVPIFSAGSSCAWSMEYYFVHTLAQYLEEVNILNDRIEGNKMLDDNPKMVKAEMIRVLNSHHMFVTKYSKKPYYIGFAKTSLSDSIRYVQVLKQKLEKMEYCLKNDRENFFNI